MYILSVLILAAALVLAACTAPMQPGVTPAEAPAAGDEEAPAAEGGKVFRFAIHEEPTSLDPPQQFGNTALQIGQNLFDGLTELTPDMQVVPALAESWDVSEDGLVYTFHLRPDVTFHNGKPFTANDVLCSWNRSISPDVASYSSWLMNPIKGAAAVQEGTATEAEGLKVIDDATFEVTLEQPTGYFLNLTTRWNYWVVNCDVIEEHGESWTEAGNLVGTGAYKLAEWVHDSNLVLEANADYFQGKPPIDRIELPIIPDASAQVIRYQAGEIDAMTDLLPADVQLAQADPTLQAEFTIYPILRTTWLGFNMRSEPFADNLALREAIAYAIDRQQIIDLALSGLGQPAYTFLPPGMPCYQADILKDIYPYNPEQAQAKLAEAGYPNGEGLGDISLTIKFGASDLNQKVFEVVQSQLNQNLGIAPTLESVPGTEYFGVLTDPADDKTLFRGSMGADYPDPQEFLELLAVSGSTTNYQGYENPEFDELVLAGNEAVDMEERCQLYQEAEQIFLNDLPIVPLYYNVQTTLVKPHVTGFQYTPVYVIPFRFVDIQTQ
jgi:ABC-type transport system substrate-binding protein